MKTIDSKKRAEIPKIIILVKTENISENLGNIVCGWKSPPHPSRSTNYDWHETTVIDITVRVFIQYIIYYSCLWIMIASRRCTKLYNGRRARYDIILFKRTTYFWWCLACWVCCTSARTEWSRSKWNYRLPKKTKRTLSVRLGTRIQV